MLLAVVDQNDCDYGIILNDTSRLEEVKKLALAGHAAWYQATNDDFENEYFDEETIESFYCVGYAEPAEELFKRNRIEYEIVDLEYDDDGEPICDDLVSY